MALKAEQRAANDRSRLDTLMSDIVVGKTSATGALGRRICTGARETDLRSAAVARHA